MKNNYLITIVGPTAIGKTTTAIALAKYYNCEIISCDSRQFFKEMKIGTAVPTEAELNVAKHHFIQHISIHQTYNVGDFEREALYLLEDLFKKNNIQILVGGSGLYVDAVLKGFDEFPEVKESINQEIKENYQKLGLEYLQKELENLDPIYYNFLSKNNPQTLQNPQRMIRFVAVCKSSEIPYSSFLNQPKKKRNFIPIIIGLEAERSILYQRINNRVEEMLNNGLLDEVIKLLPFKNINALQTVGYKELFAFLEVQKKLNFELEVQNSLLESIENIKKNTRRFAKRQITWFKKTEKTYWFDFTMDNEEIIKFVNLKISI